ncbi:MAG: zinc-ribbon domain-containing protein [Myxococcota bacterium]|nr:zinc-ribbon domain-containing protein [Myxococcota bacterium]
MIFDCPNCGAVNGVPEANLAATGTLLKCSACLQVFRVFPPDDDVIEEMPDQTGRSSLPDVTNIEPIPSHLKQSESVQGGENPQARREQATLELANGATVENLISQPVFNEESAADTTDSLSSSDKFVTTSPQGDSNSELKARTVPSALKGPDYDAFPESPNYLSDASDRSISALDFQPAARPNHEASGQKSWRAHMSDLWRRSPLSLRAAIAVFPIAFVVGLILGESKVEGTLDVQNASARNATLTLPETESTKRDDVIPLGATTEFGQASQEPSSLSAAASKSSNDTSTLKPPPIGRANRRHPRDHVAPKDHAFVLPRRLVVRAKPKKKSQFTGRFSQGDLVRVYDTVEQWTLVYMPGGGSVGFVPTKSLGSHKTLPALIAESKFQGCRIKAHRRLGLCLEHALTQETQCMDSCGAVDDTSEGSMRCRNICTGAYEVCAKSCRSRKSSRKKSKRRRGR